ncbi:dormancy/auxin associated family protein [Salix suchowensis]|nr:dormancy/auxin associated family protein [Salix suchowensis]
MGFLHKLWNETLAGPMPDSGLGELRKYDSFSARSSHLLHADAASCRTNCSKYLRNIFVDPCSAPESPSTPSTSTTPLTGKLPSYVDTTRDFRRRKLSAEALESGEPRSLAIYDLINALDR